MKVRIELSALTRVCWGCVVEVPDGTDEGDLGLLAEKFYDTVDEGDYFQDVDFWQREDARWEKSDPDDIVDDDIKVTRARGCGWTIEGP